MLLWWGKLPTSACTRGKTSGDYPELSIVCLPYTLCIAVLDAAPQVISLRWVRSFASPRAAHLVRPVLLWYQA